MKAREWILRKGDHKPTELTGRTDLLYNGQDFYRVREVLPDTVTITREDLKKAVSQCNGDPSCDFMMFDWETAKLWQALSPDNAKGGE